METVNVEVAPKFYSRKMTNDMRDDIKRRIFKHMDSESITNPMMKELYDIYAILEKKYYEVLFEQIPESEFRILEKYKCINDFYPTLNISYDYSQYIKDSDFKKKCDKHGKIPVKYQSNGWESYKLDMCAKLYYPDSTMFSRYTIITEAYSRLGDEFLDKLYAQYDLMKCEDVKIKKAIEMILKSATTTGKLVDAYPDMEKFIPDEYKEKEERYPSMPTSVKVTGVDVSSLLK